MNFRTVIILLTCAAFSLNAHSQNLLIENGITPGLRMGATYENWYSFSARKNFRGGSAEVILTPSKGRFIITGLYALQFPMDIDVDGFSYFYGVGGHVGIQGNAAPIIGVDAIAGIEYDIPGFPLLVSIDAKPGFDVISNSIGFVWGQGAVTVRYVFP
jgi:hypothetical protein